MRFVMPITDKRAVTDIAEYLWEKNERDYVLFMTGIYLGRRISDLLEYRVRDLRGKDYVEIPEKKTGDTIRSRGKENRPISRVRAWQILNEAAEAVSYNDHVSCHTMRKTFAYWLYKDSGGDISMVQDILGHEDPSITRRYIGIDQQRKDAAINGLHF